MSLTRETTELLVQLWDLQQRNHALENRATALAVLYDSQLSLVRALKDANAQLKVDLAAMGRDIARDRQVLRDLGYSPPDDLFAAPPRREDADVLGRSRRDRFEDPGLTAPGA